MDVNPCHRWHKSQVNEHFSVSPVLNDLSKECTSPVSHGFWFECPLIFFLHPQCTCLFCKSVSPSCISASVKMSLAHPELSASVRRIPKFCLYTRAETDGYIVSHLHAVYSHHSVYLHFLHTWWLRHHVCNNPNFCLWQSQSEITSTKIWWVEMYLLTFTVRPPPHTQQFLSPPISQSETKQHMHYLPVIQTSHRIETLAKK